VQAQGVWRVASASVRGASHELTDAPCQDAHRIEISTASNNQVLVVAVADGAGTALNGEAGASIAVTAICEQVSAWVGSGGTVEVLSRETVAEWITGVREQIADAAADTIGDMRDYACTLLVAVIDQNAAAFAQIGDGAIVVLTQEREWSWVFWPQHGPYANTTYFVTEDAARDRFEFCTGPRRVNELAVFSDGLEQLVLDHKARVAHAPFFDRMFPPLREASSSGRDHALSEALADYLLSQTVRARTSDDVTLVLASRLPPSVVDACSERADVGEDASSD